MSKTQIIQAIIGGPYWRTFGTFDLHNRETFTMTTGPDWKDIAKEILGG